MSPRGQKILRLICEIVVIAGLATAVFMFIYPVNPWMELARVFADLQVSMNNQPAPELVGIAQWLNTPNGEGLHLADLRGQVVLIDFWTYSCVNCQRDIPYIVEWDKKYREQGLVIIGVHSPEFRFEQNVDNVQREVDSYGIEYPIAIDNGHKTFRAYHNRYWPAKYLIDKQGNIVYMHFGEGDYAATEQKIQELLAEID